MEQLTHKVREQHWLEIIQECNASGLARKEWCQQNGISTKSFSITSGSCGRKHTSRKKKNFLADRNAIGSYGEGVMIGHKWFRNDITKNFLNKLALDC